MRQIKVLAILLSVLLTGCSLGILPEKPAGEAETVLPTTQTAPVTAEPTAISVTVPPETQPELQRQEPQDEDFVKVKTYIPDIVVELRYATENNFTHQRIYDFSDVWLRYGTVKKLQKVQDALGSRGMGLKLWDGFRPTAAQFRLWDACPDPAYVSDPHKGFSSHSRGNTVDVTLVYADGTEVKMPTDYDDFSHLADRDYSDCGWEAGNNARCLEELMKEFGFKPYSGEWWHFTDTRDYPVEERFQPLEAARYYAHCEDWISLRTAPDTGAPVIGEIPAGEAFTVVAIRDGFFLVEYRNIWGYVLARYTRPCEQ